VFNVNAVPGANGINRLPIQAQGALYRLSASATPANVTVTGYGVDGPASCFGDWRQCSTTAIVVERNAANGTQQTHMGQSLGRNGNIWRHLAETQGANSGSPLIAQDGLAVGIHRAGPLQFGITCDNNNPNSGTALTNANLQQAVQQFFGSGFIFVDRAHPETQEDGTLVRPYDTVGEGVNRAIANGSGTISIVAETYQESITINRPMLLTAPVGVVTIIGQ
jgi:hypothetical protein